jgi:hypothetical protein
MNDPHVVALSYRVEHDEHVDYDRAAPLDAETDRFHVHIADGRARFAMKVHCAIEEEARKIVEPFIRAWEIKADIADHPNVFRLVYDRPEIVDRSPPAGQVIHLDTGTIKVSGQDVNVRVSRTNFPDPPHDFKLTYELEVAYEAWRALWPKPDFLAALGYLVLTMIEGPGKPRTRPPARRVTASECYDVDLAVLNELGRLTSEKGGLYARKVEGVSADFSSDEQAWVAEAIRTLMRRLGERAHHRTAALPPITMADLPPLA